MTLKNYLTTIGVGTAFAYIAWFLILLNIDPIETSVIGVLFFYITFLAANAGLFTIIGTYARSKRKKHQHLHEIILSSLRQAIILSAIVSIALFLSHLGLLVWWTVLIIIAISALVEFFALSTGAALSE